jgi:hypothetical protein
MTTEEVAKIMSGAATRATKGLREVSDAIAELREAELMLEGLAAAQMLVENRKPPKDENPRLAYPIPEIARKLGLHRRTIEYKIQARKLEVVDFGKRLVKAESLSAALKKVPPSDGRERHGIVWDWRATTTPALSSFDDNGGGQAKTRQNNVESRVCVACNSAAAAALQAASELHHHCARSVSTGCTGSPLALRPTI